MRAPTSLRARITLAAIVAVAVGGILAGAALVAAVKRDGRRDLDNDLTRRAEGLARRGPPPGLLGAQPAPGPPDQALLSGTGNFVQVAYRDRVVERRGDVPADPPDLPAGDGFKSLDIGGDRWRSLTVTAGPAGDLRFQLLSSEEPLQHRVANLRRLVFLIGLAALLVTAMAAWAFTTVAVRPLARLRAGAARVSGAEDLDTALPEDEGPVEVRSLARALNEMLERLRESTEAMQRALLATRRFAADAGHEMRTPLTSLRANLDALERNPDLPPEQRDRLVRDTLAEQERIVHLLEGLQALARGEAAESLPREPVELGDLVDTALYAARKRHPQVRYELDERIGDATVRGWANGVRLVVDNLLDNAALHGRPEGHVRVGLSRENGALLVRVEDDGPGIPEGERERLLEPFARGELANASGTGLGLAIVSQQVALHGGQMQLAESGLGGLGVEVRLPVDAE